MKKNGQIQPINVQEEPEQKEQSFNREELDRILAVLDRRDQEIERYKAENL